MTVLLTIILLLLAVPAHATKYWIAASGGSDATDCSLIVGNTDPGTYRASVSAGAACLASGDTLHIKAGTYNGPNQTIYEPGGHNLPNGLSASNPTILEGEGIDVTIIQPTGNSFKILNGSYITVRNLTIDRQGSPGSDHSGLNFTGTHNDLLFDHIKIKNSANGGTPAGGLFVQSSSTSVRITVRDSVFHNNGNPAVPSGHGIYIQGSDVLVERCESYNNASGGFQVRNTDSAQVTTNNTLRYNKSYDNGRFGMVVYGTNAKAYGNEMYGNPEYGLAFRIAPNGIAHNNLIYNNGGYGIGCNETGGVSANCEVTNNVIFSSGTNVRFPSAGGSNTGNRNACASPGANCGANYIQIAALTAITVSTTDFRHKVGSVGINAGQAVSTRTCNGTCDLGPYETFSASSPAHASGNTVEVTLEMSAFVPVLPATGQATWVVKFGGVARNTVSAVRKTLTDSVVQITFDGAACASSDVMTVDYTVGNVTDSILVGGTRNQTLFSFTGLEVDESACTGGGGGPPPSGTTIIYHLNDASLGVCCEDSSGNANHGTISGTPTLTTGLIDGALSFSAGGSAYLGAPWGSGVNPTAQDATVCALLTVTDPSASRILFGTPPGTNQRAYVGTWGGNWVIGIQSSSGFAVNNDFPVQAGYALPCVIFSGTTAKLWVNAVVGTSAQSVKTYSSYSWAGNWTFGRANGWDATTYSGGNTTDEIFIYPSALNQSEMTELYQSLVNPSPPPPSSTREQKGHKFQRPFKKAGVAEDLRGVDEDGHVSRGGYVDVVIQLDCTGNDCPSFAPRIHRSIDGGATYAQINDVCGVICFIGTFADPDLVSADAECCLTGALTEVDGPTNFTSAAVPNITLSQDHSITLRYKLKVDSSATPGQEIYLKVYDQNGNELEGGYTPALGAKLIVKDYANGGGF